MNIYTYATIICALLATNIVLIWYAYRLVRTMVTILSDLDVLREEVDQYSKHLEGVYEMDTFYGDETLKELIRHTREIKDHCDDLNENFLVDKEDVENEVDVDDN